MKPGDRCEFCGAPDPRELLVGALTWAVILFGVGLVGGFWFAVVFA